MSSNDNNAVESFLQKYGIAMLSKDGSRECGFALPHKRALQLISTASKSKVPVLDCNIYFKVATTDGESLWHRHTSFYVGTQSPAEFELDWFKRTINCMKWFLENLPDNIKNDPTYGYVFVIGEEIKG